MPIILKIMLASSVKAYVVMHIQAAHTQSEIRRDGAVQNMLQLYMPLL